MPDATLNKLLHIVTDGESKELRHAALTVLGTVGSKDAKLVKTLVGVLGEEDRDLRIAAIEALGELQADDALAALEPFVREGGPELEAAVQAAGRLGARGAKLMGKVMQDASPSLKSRVGAVLAKSGTGNALIVTAHGLLDDDPKVIDATARSLAMEVPAYSTPQRHALAKFLIESLGAKKIPPKSEAALLRVLSALHEAKAEDLFWSRVLPPHAADVRAAALQALGNHPVPTAEKRLQALLTCAAEKEFSIVAAALMILKKVPVAAKNAKHWIKLLDAPDIATRRFAVHKLQGVETADAARAMVGQLRHPDRNLREEALQSLRSYDAGRAAVLDDMLDADEVDRVWFLARALAQHAPLAPGGRGVGGEGAIPAKAFSTAQRTKIFTQAAKYHDAKDRRAAALLFLLHEMDHAWTRDQLEAKAQELRKKRKYAEAMGYYRLLTQDPACSEETRFEMAATGLKETKHDLSPDHRNSDPSLSQFTRHLQNAAFDLIGHIAKAKWLGPEELFYVGFHFAEQTHRARDFGKQVLELVVKRSAKSEIGKQAKRKLKSEGLT